MSDPSAGALDAERAVVLVEVGGRHVALDAAETRGVARPDSLTPARGPDPSLRALVAVHGKVAAVVDPRPALGLDPLGDDVGEQHLLVVSGAAGRFALLVDDIDVATLPVSRRHAGAGTAAAAGTDAAAGTAAALVVRRGGDEIPLVPLDALVGPVLADPPPEA